MRIIVLSDTHQYYRNFETIVLRHPDADMFIHLGDGESEYQLLCRNMPEVADKFRYIKGNCDYGSEAPLTQTIDLMPGHRVFATHGHRYRVNSTLDYLEQAALEEGCDIALYGHTHVSQCTYESFNRGSYHVLCTAIRGIGWIERGLFRSGLSIGTIIRGGKCLLCIR